MSKFLKLTNFLLNTNDIHKIVIHPNKYYIHIVSKEIDGFNLGGGFGVGNISFGNISSYTCKIEVCETNNSNDYKIVSDWIDKN